MKHLKSKTGNNLLTYQRYIFQAPLQNVLPPAPKKTKTALDAINEDLNKYKAAQKLAAKSEKKKKNSDAGSSIFQFRKKNKQDDDMHEKIRAALAITEESSSLAEEEVGCT